MNRAGPSLSIGSEGIHADWLVPRERPWARPWRCYEVDLAKRERPANSDHGGALLPLRTAPLPRPGSTVLRAEVIAPKAGVRADSSGLASP